MLDYGTSEQHALAAGAGFDNLSAYDRSLFNFSDFAAEQRYCGSFSASSGSSAAAAALCGLADFRNQAAPGSGGVGSYAPGVKPSPYMSQATPHGITDILSRPDMQGFGHRSEPSGASLAASLGPIHGHVYSGVASAKPPYDLERPPPYWAHGGSAAAPTPDVRYAAFEWHRGADVSRSLSPDSAENKEGLKKKNTRPTFSGHQIFSLEKTFEQTRYLAGQDRARLARSLGMTEGQVKVWFQNRRTKWRKKTNTESTTARKRPEKQQEATTTAPQLGAYPQPPSGHS